MRSNVVFRPTVVIGLGGTGHGAVLKLKKHFIDAYGAVPPIIRFLTFDTTENVEHSENARDGSPVMLEPNEQFVIQVANPAGLLSGTNEHIDEWWPKNIPIGAIIAGAGQVRARGRLALFARTNEVFGRIRDAVRQVQLIKSEKQMYEERFRVSDRGGVEIYVVGSLAGGTGSGMFLDMAFITRSFVDSQSNITGVFVLPGIFAGRPGVNMVKPNAYGALKEIEQFSKLDRNNGFNIKYGHQYQVEVKQPPFDLIYLIDSTNEAGRGVKETSELLSLVSQGLYLQIGSQIGMDSANTVDNIKTHLSTAGRVRNRSPKYGSFGVATLTLPIRQFEIMEIDGARKLLSDGLLNGAFPDSDLETEVVRFLHDNNLREDDADDVINALSEREGGGQMRFPISLSSIKFDGTAQAMVKQLHVTHRSRMEQQVAQRLDVNYKKLHESSLQAIDEWWERAINRPNGLIYTIRFAEKLLAKLEWYQNMMESESKEEQARRNALNFKSVEEQIHEAAGAWFQTQKKVQAACENYKGLVDRESDLYLQSARRDKASELYGTLRAHVKEIRRRCDLIRQNLEGALKKIEQSYLDASARRGGESPFEHTVRFDAEGNQPEIVPEEFIKWRNDNFGTLAAWASMREEDVVRDIINFVKERYQPVTGLSIDDVLNRSNTEQVIQDLRQLERLAVPLWHYDSGKIPLDNIGVINELYHYGVANAEQTVLKDPKVFGRVPRGAMDPSFVSTLDERRIMLFKVKVGVPLFALQGIEEMERAYNDPDKVVSNHLHSKWESFPAVIPRGGDGDALRWFAIAQAPSPVGLISRRGEWYYIRSKHARRTDGGEMRLGQGRINAYAAFEKNRDLIKEVEEVVESITRTEGEARIHSVLRDYVEQLTVQVSGGNVDVSIKEQVEREIEEIDNHLAQMSKIR